MTEEPNQTEPTGVPPSVMSEPPPPARPGRFIGGWIAGLVMLGLSIFAAVGGYVEQFSEPVESFGLQESLKYQVSLRDADVPALESAIEDGLREVAKDALAEAPASDEAARVAIVAAHELGDKPPPAAIERLRKSKDEYARQMAEIYGGAVVTQELVDSFSKAKSDEFAVRLAKVHAKKMIGEPSGRDAVVDKGFIAKAAVTSVIGLLVVLAGIVCLVMFVAKLGGPLLRPVGFGAFDRADGDRYMVRFSLYMVAFIVVSLVVDSAKNEGLFGQLKGSWVSAIGLFLVLAATVALLQFPVVGRSDSLGEVVSKKKPLGKLVGIGVYGYLCTVPILVLVLVGVKALSRFVPEPSHPISSEFAKASSLDWLAIALTAVVLAPILEEIAFRGLLLPALASQLSRPIYAVLACGFLFAAIHPQGPLIWPALMTTGAVAAYLRYYSGSLVPSIVLHVVHNGAIFLMAYLLA